MHSTPSSKTATQIAAKLAHFGKKREVAYARLTKENMQKHARKMCSPSLRYICSPTRLGKSEQ